MGSDYNGKSEVISDPQLDTYSRIVRKILILVYLSHECTSNSLTILVRKNTSRRVEISSKMRHEKCLSTLELISTSDQYVTLDYKRLTARCTLLVRFTSDII